MADASSNAARQTHAWPAPDRPPPANERAYAEMIEALRDFLDKVAGARPEAEAIAALTDDLRGWSSRLADCAVDEREQPFARLLNVPGRGQTMSPALHVLKHEPGDFRAHVTFGRYYLGVNNAVHGGVLPLVFDEALGRAAADPTVRIRTAYLKTEYRALTPLETQLEVRAWLDRQEGRKRFVRGELRHGDVVCAEVEGLFIALRDDQA